MSRVPLSRSSRTRARLRAAALVAAAALPALAVTAAPADAHSFRPPAPYVAPVTLQPKECPPYPSADACSLAWPTASGTFALTGFTWEADGLVARGRFTGQTQDQRDQDLTGEPATFRVGRVNVTEKRITIAVATRHVTYLDYSEDVATVTSRSFESPSYTQDYNEEPVSVVGYVARPRHHAKRDWRRATTPAEQAAVLQNLLLG